MRWGAVAAAAEGAFLVLWATAEALPGQSPRFVSVSGLVLGDLPWIITLAFLAHAVSLAALAALLRLHGAASSAQQGMHGAVAGRGLRWAAWPLAVAALGMLLVAAFPVGPGPRTLHFIGAWLAFGGVASSAGMAATRGRPPVRWLGLVVVVGTVAMLVSTSLGLFPMFERVQLLLNGAWIFAATAPRAFSTAARSQRP